MADTKTTAESLRSPIDGTELVRLATPGANWKAPINSITRIRLFADTSFYVSTSTGSDITGDGSNGNPWKTLVFANDTLRGSYDFNGFRVDLIMKTADTYTGFRNGGGYVGGGVLSIHGATNSPGSYVIQDDGTIAEAVFHFIYDTSTDIRFDQCTFKIVSNFSDTIWLDCRARVTVAGSWGDGLGQTVNVDFSSDVTNGNGWICSRGGHLKVFGNINITSPPTKKIFTYLGSFGSNDSATGASFIDNSVITQVFSANTAFGQYAYADDCSKIWPGAFSFASGGATAGFRFNVQSNGIIDTFGSGRRFLPGTVDGLILSDGQYF